MFLPPYCPDFNPAEELFSYVKYYLREHDEILFSSFKTHANRTHQDWESDILRSRISCPKLHTLFSGLKPGEQIVQHLPTPASIETCEFDSYVPPESTLECDNTLLQTSSVNITCINGSDTRIRPRM